MATVNKRMQRQMDRVIITMKKGGDPEKALSDGPDGPMKPIDYSKPRDYYVELEVPDENDA